MRSRPASADVAVVHYIHRIQQHSGHILHAHAGLAQKQQQGSMDVLLLQLE